MVMEAKHDGDDRQEVRRGVTQSWHERPKIALIGGGNIGSAILTTLAMKDIGDVIVYDTKTGLSQGKALDITHALPIVGCSATFRGGDHISCIEGADVIIVTAGLASIAGKTPEQWTRDDLLLPNAKIIKSIGESIGKYAPGAFVIVLTNPMDIMVQLLQEASCLPPSMVAGMGGCLDSARFRQMVAHKLKVAPEDVHGMVIGAHGDTMVPLTRHVSVGGSSIDAFIRAGLISQADLDAIASRTRSVAKEVVGFLGNASASLAPAVAAVQMAEAYITDARQVLSCSTHSRGVYGLGDIYIGLPCVLGAHGVHRTLPLDLNQQEMASLMASAAEIERMKRLLTQKLAEEST